MQPGQQKHVDVEGGHQDQHGEEHGDEADDDRLALRVDNEEDPTDSAGQPDGGNGQEGFPNGHDTMVAQRVEDRDVAVDGDDQQVADGRYQGDADHGVEDIVHHLDEAVVDNEVAVVEDGNDDCLQGVGHAHQHVGHGKAAEEEVHRRVEVPVLDDGEDDQDVFQEAYDAQGQEDLCLDEHLLTRSQGALVTQLPGLIRFPCAIEDGVCLEQQ